jgi:coenzyme F420-reducing hydrogenase delta subunit
MHECQYEKGIDMFEKRLERIEDKLDSVLETRNKIRGGWLLLTVFATALLSIANFVKDLFAK